MSKSRVIRKQNRNYFKKNAKKEVMQLRRLINSNILLSIDGYSRNGYLSSKPRSMAYEYIYVILENRSKSSVIITKLEYRNIGHLSSYPHIIGYFLSNDVLFEDLRSNAYPSVALHYDVIDAIEVPSNAS